MCFRLLLYVLEVSRRLHSFPTRRSSDLDVLREAVLAAADEETRAWFDDHVDVVSTMVDRITPSAGEQEGVIRSEEHTSELQSRGHLVCRLLLEKKKTKITAKTRC